MQDDDAIGRLHVIDVDLDARLKNWARCYKDRPKVHVSMLAKMIALYGAQEEALPEERPAPVIDSKDAALVERALCSKLYPENYRLIICALYLRSDIRISKIGKAIGLSKRGFDEELRKACVMLSNLLEFYSR